MYFYQVDVLEGIFRRSLFKKILIVYLNCRGTALSHHVSLHSAPNNNSITSNLVPADEPKDTTAMNNHEESYPVQQNHEIRRPRVSFSEFNKVQFFEEPDEPIQQTTHRRHRHRSAKKSAAPPVANNHVSPPSIQHPQTLFTPYRPLSRQQPIGHELNIRKQHLIPSPRVHTSRFTHLPDILNQSLPTETSSHEKLLLQREKSFYQFPEPATELPINSSTEISRESTRAGGIRPMAAVIPDSYDQNDSATNSYLNSTSMSSSITNRQRPFLRSISLRQQFTSPLKAKPTNFSPIYQTTTTNPRRSASFKHSIIRNHSVDDNQEEIHHQNVLSTLENRPMTGINSSKHLKRNYIIHFNPKNPFNGNATIDSTDTARHFMTKSNFHEPSDERFQNVLKIVRPPYITNLHSSLHDTSLQSTTTNNHMNGSIRSSRTTSGHGSHDYHITSNTIFV